MPATHNNVSRASYASGALPPPRSSVRCHPPVGEPADRGPTTCAVGSVRTSHLPRRLQLPLLPTNADRMRNASAYGGAARGRPVAAWLVLALAAAPAAAVPAAAQQCVLQMGTQSMPFNQCTTINDIGDDFRLFWNSSAANAASVTWGMSTAGKSGYVSFAFPESPGDMVGAYALPPAAGAQLRQYYLAGTTSGSIESTTSPPINGAALAATMPGGGLAAAFTTELPEGSSPDGVPLIFAAGAVYSDGYIRCAPWLAGRHAAYLAGGQLVKQRSPPGGSVPLPSSCPLAAALPCRCRQHSTYGSGTLDLSTALCGIAALQSCPLAQACIAPALPPSLLSPPALLVWCRRTSGC